MKRRLNKDKIVDNFFHALGCVIMMFPVVFIASTWFYQMSFKEAFIMYAITAVFYLIVFPIGYSIEKDKKVRISKKSSEKLD